MNKIIVICLILLIGLAFGWLTYWISTDMASGILVWVFVTGFGLESYYHVYMKRDKE